jgi:hypothetical protein
LGEAFHSQNRQLRLKLTYKKNSIFTGQCRRL